MTHVVFAVSRERLIVTRLTQDVVISLAARKRVVTWPTDQLIVTVTAFQIVVCSTAIEMVNTGAAIKDVNASAADELVITAATINHIVAISGCDQFGTVRPSERIITPFARILIEALGKFVEVSLPNGSPMVSAARSR